MPVRAVALAALLLSAGTALLLSGCILAARHTQHALPLTVLGAVMFVPVRATHTLCPRALPNCCAPPPQGAYHTRLAYKAWRGDDDFSFDALPEL